MASQAQSIRDDGAIVVGPQPGFQTRFLSSRADITIGGGAAFCGKRLSVDTPLATPTGWTTMGAVKVGDEVFAEDGRPTRVTFVSPIQVATDSRKLVFSDGSVIYADAQHLWKTISYLERMARHRLTPEWRAKRRATRHRRGKGISPRTVQMNEDRIWEHKDRPDGAIRSTDEIAHTLKHRGKLNHAVPLADAFVLPEKDLALHPYVLGAWLGDGTGCTGVVTGNDVEVFEGIRSAGYEVQKQPSNKYGYRVAGLTKILDSMGLISDCKSHGKRIPVGYLRSSSEQRIALLQGLMDTDGSCAADTGQCEFTTTSPALRDGMMELLATLGIKATAREGIAKLHGKSMGAKWRICFFSRLPVFRITRKLQRQKRTGWGGERSFQRRIVSVEHAEPREMRCIAVEAPSHLYLAGLTCIPTHNTYAELLAPVKWVHLPDFRCTMFRRSMEEIRDQGGLWDESVKLYQPMGFHPREQMCEWRCPSGAQIVMDHLQYDSTAYHKQGSQIALLTFDELTHFSKFQFWYLFGRNRSTCGIRPYTLASCNPDADSWVAELIAWWINQETGDPIPERSGVLRWFTRDGDDILWGNNRREVLAQLHDGRVSARDIRSMTFIPGSIDDNAIGNAADPGYRGRLMAMTRVERARLLDGNWKVRKSAGSYFRRSDVKVIDSAPTNLEAITRRWDLAASEPTEAYPNPDYTCGVKLGRYKDGRFVVLHVELERKRANEVRELVKRLAVQDGDCSVGVPQDPAQAGKDQSEDYVLFLAGHDVYAEKESGDKQTRAEPVAAQWQHQNIDVVKGTWNDAFFAQLEAFPDPKVHDDAVDALSGAFKHLLSGPDIFSYYR